MYATEHEMPFPPTLEPIPLRRERQLGDSTTLHDEPPANAKRNDLRELQCEQSDLTATMTAQGESGGEHRTDEEQGTQYEVRAPDRVRHGAGNDAQSKESEPARDE